MDSLEAITKIIDSLAWPVLTGGVVYAFSDKFGELIGNIKSMKAGGAEVEIYEKQLQSAVAKVVSQTEELQEEKLLAGDGRNSKTEALNVAVVNLASLVEAKRELALNLEWMGLSPGRERILRSVIDTIGPEGILAMSTEEIQSSWPRLFGETGLNGGAITGLRGVGIVDNQNKLTNIGAGLIHALAREIIAYQNLSQMPASPSQLGRFPATP